MSANPKIAKQQSQPKDSRAVISCVQVSLMQSCPYVWAGCTCPRGPVDVRLVLRWSRLVRHQRRLPLWQETTRWGWSGRPGPSLQDACGPNYPSGLPGPVPQDKLRRYPRLYRTGRMGRTGRHGLSVASAGRPSRNNKSQSTKTNPTTPGDHAHTIATSQKNS